MGWFEIFLAGIHIYEFKMQVCWYFFLDSLTIQSARSQYGFHFQIWLINTVFALLLFFLISQSFTKGYFQKGLFWSVRHRVSPGGSSRVWKKRVRVEKALGEQNLPSIEFQKNRVYTTTFLPSKWNSKKKSFIYPTFLPSIGNSKKKSFIYPHLPSFHREFKKRFLYIPTFLPSIGNSKIKGFISQPSFLP